MKKLLLCLLAALLALTVLSACGTKEENADTDEDSGVEIEKEETEEISQETKKAESTKKPTETVEKIEETSAEKELTPEEINDLVTAKLIYCEYKDKIIPSDHENYIGWFQADNGEVFVSVKMELHNKSENKIKYTKKDISGYFTYGGKRCDLNNIAVENVRCNDLKTVYSASSEVLLPGEKRLVHLFAEVDSKAEKENLVVTCTAFGEKNEAQVKQDSATYTLKDKNEVTVGSTLKIDDLYEFQIIECKVKTYITAQDYANSEQIYFSDSILGSGNPIPVIDLVLKVKNKTNDYLDSGDLVVYTMMDDEVVKDSGLKMEVEKNTDFAALKLEAGREEYVHFICKKIDGASGDHIRFNINNKCYYCKVEK